MSQDVKGSTTTKTFPHAEEDRTFESLIEKRVEGALESGAKFWGTLESFDANWLFLRGNRDQAIIIRRRKLAALFEAI
jgi:hypothetical protein